MSAETYTVTINFIGVDLDADDRDAEVLKLLRQMKELDEVEAVRRVPDLEPPENSKSIGGFIVGILTAEINVDSTKKVFAFFSEHLAGKSIEMEVEANGKKLKVVADNPEELLAAVEAAERFISA